MTSLIMDKLSEAIEATNAELAVVSDVACLFLDKEIADEESQTIYNQAIAYLAQLAKEKQIIIVATYPPHNPTKRNAALQTATNASAAIAASIKTDAYHRYFVLQKHPHYTLGSAEFLHTYTTLPEFFEGAN